MVVRALNLNLEIIPPQRFLSPQVLIKQKLKIHAKVKVSSLNVWAPPSRYLFEFLGLWGVH